VQFFRVFVKFRKIKKNCL